MSRVALSLLVVGALASRGPLGEGIAVADPAAPERSTPDPAAADRAAAEANALARDGKFAAAAVKFREAWQAANPDTTYGRPFGGGVNERPGLHVSCLPFLRDHDAAVLVWDMLDHLPIGHDIPWAVHAAIFAYGVALLDNALLEPLAKACQEDGRDEFMLVIAPLRVRGGTGSPTNPLALF